MTDLIELKTGLIVKAGCYVTYCGDSCEIVGTLPPEATRGIGADGLITIIKNGKPLAVFPQHIGCVWSGDEAGCVETNEENGETAMTNEDTMIVAETKTEAPAKVSIVRVDDDSDILEGTTLPEWKEEWEEASHVQDKLDDYSTAVDDFNRLLEKLVDAQKNVSDTGSELECALDDLIGELSDFEEEIKVPASNIIDDRIQELQDRINLLEERKAEWERLPKRAREAQKALHKIKHSIDDGNDLEEIDINISWEDIEEAITN